MHKLEKIGLIAGVLFSLYLWFGFNTLKYDIKYASMYQALTDLDLATANGFEALTKGEVWIMIAITTAILGWLFVQISGWVFKPGNDK